MDEHNVKDGAKILVNIRLAHADSICSVRVFGARNGSFWATCGIRVDSLSLYKVRAASLSTDRFSIQTCHVTGLYALFYHSITRFTWPLCKERSIFHLTQVLCAIPNAINERFIFSRAIVSSILKQNINERLAGPIVQ